MQSRGVGAVGTWVVASWGRTAGAMEGRVWKPGRRRSAVSGSVGWEGGRECKCGTQLSVRSEVEKGGSELRARGAAATRHHVRKERVR